MRKADEVKMEWAIETGRRSDLERARDAAMLHALFFWQLSERAVHIKVRAAWEKKGDDAMGAALRLEQQLNGAPRRRRRRARST
jgi:hypothetical protein